MAFAAKWADTPSGQDCIITKVFVTYRSDSFPETAEINGVNFDNGDYIDVTSGNFPDPLTIDSVFFEGE